MTSGHIVFGIHFFGLLIAKRPLVGASMNRITPLLLVATGILAFATLMLVILPGWQVRTIEPPKALSPYTLEQLSGRQQYIANGCVYCHSQQPRSTGQTFADLARGWGGRRRRATTHTTSRICWAPCVRVRTC